MCFFTPVYQNFDRPMFNLQNLDFDYPILDSLFRTLVIQSLVFLFIPALSDVGWFVFRFRNLFSEFRLSKVYFHSLDLNE